MDKSRREREGLSERLSGCKNLIRGSLVVNRRRCGKEECRCNRGQLHESLAFTYKEGGKSFLLHIPKHLEGEARKANKHYKRLKDLVRQLSKANIEILKRKIQVGHLPRRGEERSPR